MKSKKKKRTVKNRIEYQELWDNYSWFFNNTAIRGADPLCSQKSAYNFTAGSPYPWIQPTVNGVVF